MRRDKSFDDVEREAFYAHMPWAIIDLLYLNFFVRTILFLYHHHGRVVLYSCSDPQLQLRMCYSYKYHTSTVLLIKYVVLVLRSWSWWKEETYVSQLPQTTSAAEFGQ
jgi:hypothetical protein